MLVFFRGKFFPSSGVENMSFVFFHGISLHSRSCWENNAGACRKKKEESWKVVRDCCIRSGLVIG